MNITKLTEIYNNPDLTKPDCIRLAASFQGIELPEFDSYYKAYKWLIKTYGTVEQGILEHGYKQVLNPLVAKRGAVILRGKTTVGIYTGNGLIQFMNGIFQLEPTDKIFEKEVL